MLMDRFDYKTKRTLLRKMKKCGVHLINDQIRISPSNHKTLESWQGTSVDGSDDLILSVDSTPVEIGAGLRLTVSRCT